MMILSGDTPRSRVLSLLLIVIIAALILTPVVFPGAKAMNVATKILIFAALVASYDLLLGYTGSVSFAHTMFYGIGSYSIAIALYSMGPNWAAVATGIVIGLPLALLLALAIGLFSLRVEAIFFAMITLAVASAFLVLASQLSWLTGGEDGRSFQLPELLRPGTVYGAIIGAAIFILAQNYLQALMGAASNAAADAGLPLLPGLLHPDRWLLWLGLLFIASVYFFPTGVVGRLRNAGRKPS